MLMPRVSRFMSLDPVTIGPAEPMAVAHRLMRDRKLRHLPVVEHGRLVGIVSDRDLHLLESLRDVNPAEVTVGEAMTADVYAVPPDTALDEVASEMMERKLGSVVIVGPMGIEGIFTAVDALRALVDVLAREAA
jgi:acetoin utilization protein AcuB